MDEEPTLAIGDAAALRNAIGGPPPDAPGEPDAALERLLRDVVPWTARNIHPRWFARRATDGRDRRRVGSGGRLPLPADGRRGGDLPLLPRDEVDRDAEELLRLAARAEFSGNPLAAVATWLEEQAVG